MSEDSEQITEEQQSTVQTLSHKRIFSSGEPYGDIVLKGFENLPDVFSRVYKRYVG